MDKSHVSLGQQICIVTGEKFDSGEILLDKRLKDTLKKHTVTGWGLSPKVQEKIDEGYIALVGVDEKQSKITDNRIKPEDAYRTGEVLYLKKEVWNKIFNIPQQGDFAFLDTEALEHIKKMFQ